MAFRNDVVGGTILLRDAIQSTNYQSGSAGWTINQDGTAEFNSVVIRGGTVISGTSLYYDPAPGAGNLILSIAAAAGTDPYGNAYPAGLAVYSAAGTVTVADTGIIWQNVLGAQINIDAGGATALAQFTPAAVGGVTWSSGAIGTNTTTDFGPNTPGIFIESPNATSHPTTASIGLYGGSPSSNGSLARIRGNLVALDDAQIVGKLSASNMASGSVVCPAPGGVPAQTTANVVFATAFPSTPRIVLTPQSATANLNGANIRWSTMNTTTSGFTVQCWRDTNFSTSFDWHALSA